MRKRDRTPKTYTRLTHPLVRDSATSRSGGPPGRRRWTGAAAGTRAQARGAFGMFSCARATNEMNYVAQKFTRVVMGTNNVDSCNRTCHAPSVAGLSAAFGSGGGTSSYEEVEHTDLIVMWGSNARFAHPIFFQHVLKGHPQRRPDVRGRPAPHLDRRVGGELARAQRRHGHPAGARRSAARSSTRGCANQAFIERATSGFEEYAAAGRAVDAVRSPRR